ncbi:PhoH family protein, partial [Mycobacterium tuberculosis]|nr:PhoH family protein [Mycobacterium tuberculosis]
LKDYTHQKNNVWGVTARNREQNFALNLLMHPEVDFVSLLGQAGTGKTLLAKAVARGAARAFRARAGREPRQRDARGGARIRADGRAAEAGGERDPADRVHRAGAAVAAWSEGERLT